MIFELDGIQPVLKDETVWIAETASVIGNVHLEKNSSIWFNAVIRGDNDPITIGENSNIQDGSILHTDPGKPITIGKNVTVGHMVMLHGCEIGDNSLIGMGATILNGAKIGNNCIVGANALITEGKEFPDGTLILGSPAKAAREVSEHDRLLLEMSSKVYVANADRFKKGLKKV
ncbi:gamma carbonic anhydrase family protein [Temperatibacter marinus]|uniref:Gamma carbonic anhydrase family protein n=1 Tax=Temperatibacter marinus TaxID=1456591 RepID=A0AA52EGJ4_9PROT|nr:gamma carbonic anhydrase family protein [Temperatibacter marinus]WND02119.1 gamma carbonic anhydrase family protein [Temperatibacter marinus]